MSRTPRLISRVTEARRHLEVDRVIFPGTLFGDVCTFSSQTGDKKTLLSKEFVVCLAVASFVFSVRLNVDSTAIRSLLRRYNIMMQ